MNLSFNLVDRPWLPCVRADGTLAELSLRQALGEAHQLRDLGGESPLVTAALYRLLLVILHRVLGPADHDQWETLWRRQQWPMDPLNAYLDRWAARFDLFDPQFPFYQAADERVKPKSVASLIHQVASGNNATLFDHTTDDGGLALSPAAAARLLVASQSFGLAGLAGIPGATFTDAPCAPGIAFFVMGDTLFETLALNLMCYPNEQIIPLLGDDRPAWEMDDPFDPPRTRPLGYLDYLTWQNRRVLLIPEQDADGVRVGQMTMGPALRLDSDVLNPLIHYRRDEKLGPRPLTFVEDRALWRDSSALFRLSDQGLRPPQVFQFVAELVDYGILDKAQTRRSLALGMSKKQAKVFFYRSELLPLPPRYLTDQDLAERLGEALGMAEGVGRRLWGATRTLATFVLEPEADLEGARQPVRQDLDNLMAPWGVERAYWGQLEPHFERLLFELPAGPEQALRAWSQVLRRAARRALNGAADTLDHSPRSLKAAVRARGQLAAGLKKELPDDEMNE